MRAKTGSAVRGRLARASFGLLAVGAITGVALAASASGASSHALRDVHGTKALWHATPAGRSVLTPATKLRVRPNTYRLQRAGLARVLALAPQERSRAARTKPLVVSIPTPDGSFQRFRLEQSAIMAPGLARKHPEIKTYSGRGIDVHADTIHADLSPLGFHASVRGPQGSWYVEPFYRGSQSLYVSYYGRAVRDSDVPFVERDAEGAELSVDHGYYHPDDDVVLHGDGFGDGATVTIAISDPEEHFATREVTAEADSDGHFDATFTADPNGDLDTHIVTATAGSISASESYQVVSADDTTKDPPTGDILRTYRLALITDPGYSAYVGGSGERDRGQGRAHQPGRPGLRGRHVDPDDADREQRPAQSQRLGRRHRAQRPLRRGRLLHAGPGHRLLEHDPRAVRDRPDHRRVELRHRPPRPRRAGRRSREPRRRRSLEQGRRLHGHPDPGG